MSERFEQAALQRFHQREAERGVPEGVQAGGFVAGTQEGDPEKRDYLHSHGRSLRRNIMVQGFRTDDRQCPGCIFPDAPPRKWPHTGDYRCQRRGSGGIAFTGSPVTSPDELADLERRTGARYGANS